jgi:hypothetical protein
VSTRSCRQETSQCFERSPTPEKSKVAETLAELCGNFAYNLIGAVGSAR